MEQETRRFETYNIHNSQDVLLDVSPAMVSHHHLICHHQGFHVALAASRALQRQLSAAHLVGGGFDGSLPPIEAFTGLFIWNSQSVLRRTEACREHQLLENSEDGITTELVLSSYQEKILEWNKRKSVWCRKMTHDRHWVTGWQANSSTNLWMFDSSLLYTFIPIFWALTIENLFSSHVCTAR